ncbi:MAG: hypothetical protein MUO72_02470 [Bacteroidales bacterium]|nr:hypothetical protein [Bacteroidales bacterium]
MKKLLMSIIIIANVHFCFSQEIIDLHYDSKKKEFKEKTESIKFKSGETYQVKIHNVNTSYISWKLESKSYILSSSTPDIIKPIFLGITDEALISKYSLKKESLVQLNKVYLRTIDYYNNLQALKSNSDSLYKWNLKKIDTGKADSIRNIVFGIYKVDSLLKLKRNVNLAIKYIEVANELFKAKMPEINTDELIKNKIIENYAEISYVLDIVKSDNYLKYVKFIESSLKPQVTIMSEPFKAEKDVVDLKITLIDNYKPDTLYNFSVSFYTHGNGSFDFSTGFFFNNLYEDSYYLEKRDTTVNSIKNVKENDNCNFDVSFGALGHYSYKIQNNIKLGISMGAALSPLDGKIRYLVGSSLLLGRNKQVGINVGLILAKMKALNGEVKSDDEGNYVSKDVTSVPTYDKINSGFYLGVTYNLISKKK